MVCVQLKIMLLRSLVLYQLVETLLVHAAYDAPSITCVCSTTHCTEHQISTCNTTGVCFSQYLDRKDGSPTEVKGCIASKTPLLCENRRPAVASASWPVLLCCDSNFCNRDVRPTPPFWVLEESSKQGISSDKGTGAQNERIVHGGIPSVPLKSESSTSVDVEGSDAANGQENSSGSSRQSRFPRIVSPVYISVLILGLISLIVIGIVAAVVLRRNNKFYAEQYGALERNEEYFKQPLRAPSLDDGDSDIGQGVASCPHHQHFHQLSPDSCCHVAISRT